MAIRARPLKPGALAIVIGLCAYVGFGVVFFDFGNDRWLIPALLGIMWCLSALALIYLFQSVPDFRDSAGVGSRIAGRLKRSWYWIVGVLWTISTLAVLVLTFRLGALWMSLA